MSVGFDCTLGGIFTDCGALLTYSQLTLFEVIIAGMVYQLWRWVKNTVATHLGIQFSDSDRYTGISGEIRRRLHKWRARRRGVQPAQEGPRGKPTINKDIMRPKKLQANGGRDQ